MKNSIHSKSRFFVGVGILFTIVIISLSCSKSSLANMTGTSGNTNGTGNNTPGANEVFIQGMTFNPATITVTAGTAITWTNKDAVIHNVTSNPVLFSSGSMGNGATYSYTFADKGTYSYTCTVHPSMKGTVVVN